MIDNWNELKALSEKEEAYLEHPDDSMVAYAYEEELYKVIKSRTISLAKIKDK